MDHYGVTDNHKFSLGVTFIEVMIVLAILGLLAFVAVPAYQNYQSRTAIEQAIEDIGAISQIITKYQLTNNRSPINLAEIGKDGMKDPWGNPYQYVNHNTASINKKRKDKSLIPVNNDYDLYSMGKDGISAPPLAAEYSYDDIVRANNGKWIGKSENY